MDVLVARTMVEALELGTLLENDEEVEMLKDNNP